MRFYQQLKNIYHLIKAILANFWFGFPSKKIKVIGVTGTNGKTTTVQMIGKIIEEAGYNVAINSTINYKIGEKDWVNKTKFTTVSSWELQNFIKEAIKADCEYLILETSSHALDQYRVWGVDYDVAVITNITREHLDYHQTMDEYKNAKLRLFRKLNNNFQFSIFNNKSNKEKKESIIVNLNMKWAEKFLEVEVNNRYGYFLKMSNSQFLISNKILNKKIKKVEAKNVELNNYGSNFKIGSVNFKLNLSGEFNIENALAAVCVGLSQNINLEKCSQALNKIKKISGRMDYVRNNRRLNIIIDYALTPDSMEKLGKLMVDIIDKKSDSRLNNKIELLNLGSRVGMATGNKNKLIWVFGACGERDRGKRPIMGEIVSKYADVVIVTNEDPYHEDPEQVVDEIVSGIQDTRNKIQDTIKSQIPNHKSQINSKNLDSKLQNKENESLDTGSEDGMTDAKVEKIPEGEIEKSKLKEKMKNKTFFKIMNRKEAIKKAIEMAQEGDYVLITGKGAEETMAIGDERIEWNDRQIVEGILDELS